MLCQAFNKNDSEYKDYPILNFISSTKYIKLQDKILDKLSIPLFSWRNHYCCHDIIVANAEIQVPVVNP